MAGAPDTSENTHEIICSMMKATNRIPIRVKKEIPGYLINRIQAAMEQEALQLWSEEVATAEEIEKGIKTTFGFRMPHEGPMSHYDLAGIWKWPYSARMAPKMLNESADPMSDKIKNRIVEGTSWLLEPENFDETVERRDREYIRRLKALYSELT